MHNGLKIGTVMLDTGRGFVTGMAGVAQEILTLASFDVPPGGVEIIQVGCGLVRAFRVIIVRRRQLIYAEDRRCTGRHRPTDRYARGADVCTRS